MVCTASLLLRSTKKSLLRRISVFCLVLYFRLKNLVVIEKFQANKITAYRFPLWCSQPENSVPFVPARKFSEIHTESFGPMESVPSLRAKKFIWKYFPPTFSFSCKSNSFSYERFCTKTRFEAEAQGNSEVAYFNTYKRIFNWQPFINRVYNITKNTAISWSSKLNRDVLAIMSSISRVSNDIFPDDYVCNTIFSLPVNVIVNTTLTRLMQILVRFFFVTLFALHVSVQIKPIHTQITLYD